jgi:hypothetical protein
MIAKTKKYQLDKNTFLKLGLKNILLEWWWAFLVPVAIMIIPIFVSGAFWWCFSIALLLTILYVLFWAIQFAGVSQLEQSKMLFQKFYYEISSREILAKINEKEGMQISWDKITKVKAGKDHFLLFLSKVQFFHFPHNIFRTEHDLKVFETVLRRKNLLAQPKETKPSKPQTTPAKP